MNQQTEPMEAWSKANAKGEKKDKEAHDVRATGGTKETFSRFTINHIFTTLRHRVRDGMVGRFLTGDNSK